jgi:hypothetical protein
MAALIGALRVSLSADTAAFQQGMKRAESQAKTSASSIQRSMGLVKASFAGFISGLSIGAITQGIKASLDYAGSLGEIAQQLGVTTRELQTFRYAVSQNGGSIEQADQALGKFSIALSKALSGSKQTAAAFQSVGVSLADLRSKSKSEVIGQIADNMKAAGGASANAAAGVALFGRGFQKIIPTLDQGSAGMNELAAAADELGIVLSDEQIQNADRTADKLDALMTVLKAKIAGDVADNSNSILQFVDALFELVRAAEQAKNALAQFEQNFNLPNLLSGKGQAFGLGVPGRSVTVSLADAKRTGGRSSSPTGAPRQFLGGGGGGKTRSRRAPRDTSLRDAFQFEEDQRRLDQDILRAKQDLAHDYVERTALAVEMLNLEKQSFEAELQYQVAAKEITGAQAEAKRLKFNEVDHLRRMAVLEDEEEQRRRDYNMLDDRDFDAKMELLERQADLAETASERRDAELRILDLAYEEERRRLERIVRESKDWAEIESARRQLLDLSKRQSLDRAGITQATRGPMEDWLSQLPTTAARAQEAFEMLQVQGFEGLIDSALALSEGFDSAKDALLGTLKQFLLGMAKMELQKALGGLISGGFKLPGFSLGGTTLGTSRQRIAGFVHGEEGILNPRGLSALGVPNLNALNRGMPLSRLVSNDNGGGRPVNQTFNVYANDADSFRRSENQIRRSSRRRLGVQA